MKLNKFITLLMSFAMLVGVSACTDEVSYDPASKESNEQVYFSNDESEIIDLSENQSSFTINVYRQNTDGALTVGLQIADANNGLFTFPSSVSFADGQSVTTATIGVDFSQIEPETQYTFTASVDALVATAYGASSKTYIVQYAPWSDYEYIGTGDYYSPFWDWTWESVYVYRSSSLINSNLEKYYLELNTGYDDPCAITIKLDKETNECTVEPAFDYDGDYGKIYLSTPDYYKEYAGADWYDYYNEGNGYNLDVPSVFNPETGRFDFNFIYFIKGGDYDKYIWYYGPGTTYLQLDGYMDYNITIANYGHWVDENNVDNAVIHFEKSSDVSYYKYQLVSGDLSDAEIQSVVSSLEADENASQLTDSQYVTFPLTESGTYTVVAVGFDSSNSVVCSNSLAFKFKLVTDTTLTWDDIETRTLYNSYTYSYNFGYSDYWTINVKFDEGKFLIVDFLGSGANVEVQYNDKKVTSITSDDSAASLAADGSYLALVFNDGRHMYPMGNSLTSSEMYLYPSYSSQALATYKDIVLCAYTYYDDTQYSGCYEYYYIFPPDDVLSATSVKAVKKRHNAISGKVLKKKVNFRNSSLQRRK